MSKERQNRLRKAKEWFSEQGFTEDSHIVKAYRKKFNVDKDCAMRELCMLHVLALRNRNHMKTSLLLRSINARKEESQRSISIQIRMSISTLLPDIHLAVLHMG